MDDALLHIFRNLLRVVLQRGEEGPFLKVETPPTMEVEGPLAGGGGIIPAVGGTIIERPTLTLSSPLNQVQPPKVKPIETKVDVKVEVRGSEIVVHEGKVVDPLGREFSISKQTFSIPSTDSHFYLVVRNGKVVWTVTLLPTDVPLYFVPSKIKSETEGRKDGKETD